MKARCERPAAQPLRKIARHDVATAAHALRGAAAPAPLRLGVLAGRPAPRAPRCRRRRPRVAIGAARSAGACRGLAVVPRVQRRLCARAADGARCGARVARHLNTGGAAGAHRRCRAAVALAAAGDGAAAASAAAARRVYAGAGGDRLLAALSAGDGRAQARARRARPRGRRGAVRLADRHLLPRRHRQPVLSRRRCRRHAARRVRARRIGAAASRSATIAATAIGAAAAARIARPREPGG